MKKLTEAEALDIYDDYINENHPKITIMQIEFLQSDILKELDPVAYRTYFIDFIDAVGIEIEEENQGE